MQHILKKCIFSVISVLILVFLLASSAYAAETKVTAECPSYSFTALDGSTVTPATDTGKTKLIVFIRAGDVVCSNSVESIRHLAGAEWADTKDLSIIAVDCDGASTAQLQNFADAYGNSGTDITFCLANGNKDLWGFLRAVGYSGNSITLPASFIVDSAGDIRSYLTGPTNLIDYQIALADYVSEITPPAKATISVTGTFSYSEAYRILELVNEQRVASSLEPLRLDQALMDAAMQRAAECSIYYSHTRPNGTNLRTLLSGASVGENIAIGQFSADDVMNSWMNSDGHRANILGNNYNSIGIGAFYHDGNYYWTQVFSSTPASGVETREDVNGTALIEVLDTNLSICAESNSITMDRGQSKKVNILANNVMFAWFSARLDVSCLSFRSDNTAVVKVDAQGNVSAVASGSANIIVVPSGSKQSLVIPVTVREHIFGNWYYTKTPTCVTEGLHRRDCINCEYFETESAGYANHSYDSGKITKQPSCKIEGEKTFTCTVCNGMRTEAVAKLTTHTYGNWSKVDDTTHKRRCTVCAKEETASHNWNSGAVTKQPTCKEAGVKTYACTVCNGTKTEAIAKTTTHTYDNICDTFCNVCGAARTATHSYQTAWSSDKTNHWHECSVCKDKKDFAVHTPGAAATETTPQTCTACGYVLKAAVGHTHKYSSTLTYNSTGHWYVCSGCSEKKSLENHSFDNACDTKCDTCGYTRTVTHSYQTAWSSDKTNHWHECSVCKDKKDFAAHTPGAAATETTPQTCTACGYVLKVALGHTHSFGNTWHADDTNHWRDCACGEKTDQAAHTWDGSACSVCGTQNPTPPTEPPTESPTEPPTESSTEPPTESSTEPPTESSTEPPTESSTEPPTESSTEPPTESPTAPSAEPSGDSAEESGEFPTVAVVIAGAVLLAGGGAGATAFALRKKK